IVAGGGVALLRSVSALDKLKVSDNQKVGVNIVRRALEEPIRQIVNNAGLEASIVVQEVRNGKDDYGFDARSEDYVNMFKTGIIDPTKVTRVAIENAASISGLLLTTEAAVTEIPEKESPMPPMPPGGDMGGMGGMGGMM
ncbi:MAG: TCP-1/cpn60 chaperonin family protein, partial [SAR324 cluster bacterium]|nr:TCP-1/cpn60 chaperonin family protein [SAR324 cluster bacterium]